MRQTKSDLPLLEPVNDAKTAQFVSFVWRGEDNASFALSWPTTDFLSPVFAVLVNDQSLRS